MASGRHSPFIIRYSQFRPCLRRSGFTLIECLAALTVLMIGLVSIFSLFLAGTATHKKGVDQTTAGVFAQKVLAELQARFTDEYVKELAKKTGSVRSTKFTVKDVTDPEFPGPYRYDLALAAFDNRRDTFAATLTVKWLEGGVQQSAVFETVLLRRLER